MTKATYESGSEFTVDLGDVITVDGPCQLRALRHHAPGSDWVVMRVDGAGATVDEDTKDAPAQPLRKGLSGGWRAMASVVKAGDRRLRGALLPRP